MSCKKRLLLLSELANYWAVKITNPKEVGTKVTKYSVRYMSNNIE